MHDNFYIKEKQKKLTQQKHARKHVIEEKTEKKIMQEQLQLKS